jgi:type III secretion protein V
MTDALTRALIAVSRRSDLAIAALVLVAVIMMIVPLPTALVDTLIAANIAGSVLILLVAFYVAHPVDFTSLPSVILLATLFRLAITITTSRLILLQADAGEIVSAFGNFVIGGNIAVGLVVFIIITIAQFVVITKGAERVAEVAARFNLDALPGKQMSIDSDLRSGDIDKAEALRLRRRLGQESQLYGAMDGAMKFVKGDAIASLIIIIVNLLGGLAVGSLQHGLSLGEATETYSLLTVGDGLVAQIPALLLSVGAGTVVTRVAGKDPSDLGTEITGQLFRDPRVLALGAAIMLGLTLIPGFPVAVFIALSAAFAIGTYVTHRRVARDKGHQALASAQSSTGSEAAKPANVGVTADAKVDKGHRHRVVAVVGHGLAAVVPVAEFRVRADRVRQDIAADLGIDAPAIGLAIDETASPDCFRVEVEEIPVAEGEIAANCLLVEDDPVNLDVLGVAYRSGPALLGREPALWVERQFEATLADAGISFCLPIDVLARCLSAAMRRYATQFVGIQETRALIASFEREYPELVKEAQKITPLQKIADVLRRLLEENIPIRNLRLVLEALIEWGPREQDVVLLVEYVRMALRREICFRHADSNRIIAAYVLERAVEDVLRSSIRSTTVGTFLSISDRTARPIIDQIRSALAAAPAAHPVVLVSMDVRRHVRNLLTRNDLDAPVLSYQELATEFSVQPLATIAAETEKLGQSAELRLEPDAANTELVARQNGHGATVAAAAL